MLECRCYGQHSHENESRAEISRREHSYEPFSSSIRHARINSTVRVLFKTPLIFPRINGPNVTLTPSSNIGGSRPNREIKSHVYAKRQIQVEIFSE